MKVSRVEWLLILIGVGLLLVFPALYYQTKGFPTYQDWQELAPPQTVHIINGTVSQDSQSPYYVTFQQIEFSAVDKLSYDFSTGGPAVKSFLEGSITVRFNVTQEGTVHTEMGSLGMAAPFFALSPNGHSLGSYIPNAKPGTYYLNTPFYDQSPGYGDLHFRAEIHETFTKSDPSLAPSVGLSIAGAVFLAISGYLLIGVKRATAFTLIALLIAVPAYLYYTAPPAPPKSYPTVYIRPDGSIQGTDSIATNDNVTYSLVNEINASLIVQKDNVMIDGTDHTIQGPGNGIGIDLTDRTNVTLMNANIEQFEAGIRLENSSDCNIVSNSILRNKDGIDAHEFSMQNIISLNNITENDIWGIELWYAQNNMVLDNYLAGNAPVSYGGGISLDWYSDNNTIVGNSLAQNSVGMSLFSSTNETIVHNNFESNNRQVSYWVYILPNTWDNGYPSGGNYWSEYTGTDDSRGPGQNITGSDGIGDTYHPAIESYSFNLDMYPLMQPYGFNDTYGVHIVPAAHGTTNPPPRSYSHLKGTQVNVSANPDLAYNLTGWLVNGQETKAENPITITLNANYTVQPIFTYVPPPQMGECTQDPPADNVQQNQSVKVSQVITTTPEEGTISSVSLWYTTNNFTSAMGQPMTYNNVTGVYEATIPGQPTGTEAKYWTQVFNQYGSVATNDNKGQYFTYTVK